MWNFIRDIFGPKTKSVIGVDIGSSAIKIVQIKKKGEKAFLETYGALALGPYSGAQIGQSTSLPPEKIAEALADIMREAKISSKKCGIAIPSKFSLTSFISLPAASQNQLEAIIPIEARKYIPIPISEVMIDWSIIPQEKNSPGSVDDKINILLVAIPNDAIARYQEIIQKSKLEASFLEIEVFGAMRSVVGQENAPILVFDMGAGSTKLYILERGVVHATHSINRGSQDITKTISNSLQIPMEQAEKMKRDVGLLGGGEGKKISEAAELTLDYIFSEANRVILNFEKKHNKSLSKIILVGGGSALKGFKELAVNNFRTLVVAGNPFSKVETPAFLEKVLEETGPEFAVAMGVALRRLAEEE